MRDPGLRVRVFGDASGAVADLGLLIPIAAALIVQNGLAAGTVLVGAGALYVAAGLYFKVPVPVQPIKAAAAIAIARDLPAATIGAAGFLLGLLLVILSVTGAARLIVRVFTRPIVRGLQLGVGLLLLKTALQLPPPSVGPWTWMTVALVALLLVIAARAVASELRHRGLQPGRPVVGAHAPGDPADPAHVRQRRGGPHRPGAPVLRRSSSAGAPHQRQSVVRTGERRGGKLRGEAAVPRLGGTDRPLPLRSPLLPDEPADRSPAPDLGARVRGHGVLGARADPGGHPGRAARLHRRHALPPRRRSAGI